MYTSELGLSAGQMVPSLILQDSQDQIWVMPRDVCTVNSPHLDTFLFWLGRGSLLHLPPGVGVVGGVAKPGLEMSVMCRELT